jgi:hypothetical protein
VKTLITVTLVCCFACTVGCALPGAESAARIGIATAKVIHIINPLRIRIHVRPQSFLLFRL